MTEEILDLAKSDPELHAEVVLDAPDTLDDSDTDEAPVAGKTDNAR